MNFREQTFDGERINVDGNTFTGCTLRNCTLAGAQPFQFSANTLRNCSVEFTSAAATTLKVLEGLYHGGFREVVEQTFENIRKEGTGGAA